MHTINDSDSYLYNAICFMESESTTIIGSSFQSTLLSHAPDLVRTAFFLHPVSGQSDHVVRHRPDIHAQRHSDGNHPALNTRIDYHS